MILYHRLTDDVAKPLILLAAGAARERGRGLGVNVLREFGAKGSAATIRRLRDELIASGELAPHGRREREREPVVVPLPVRPKASVKPARSKDVREYLAAWRSIRGSRAGLERRIRAGYARLEDGAMPETRREWAELWRGRQEG